MRRLIIAAVFILSACGTPTTSTPVQPVATPYKVSYRLTLENGGADITYTNKSGATEQAYKSATWRLDFDANPGQHLYLSAQVQQLSHAQCEILVNGRSLQKAEVNGGYKIATCSGVAG